MTNWLQNAIQEWNSLCILTDINQSNNEDGQINNEIIEENSNETVNTNSQKKNM